MFSTENVLTVFDYVPIWLVKLKVEFTLHEKIFLTAPLLYFVTVLIFYTSYKVDSINAFVTTVSYLFGVPTAVTCLWYIWFKSKDPHASLQEFQKFDSEARFENLKSFDILIILVVFSSGLWWSASLLYVLYFIEISLSIVSVFYAWGVLIFFQIQVLVMKYLIFKRFSFIGQQLKEEHILDKMPLVRRLVNINEKINTFYSLVCLVSLSFFFMNSVETFAWAWLNYGLKKESPQFAKMLGNSLVVISTVRTAAHLGWRLPATV